MICRQCGEEIPEGSSVCPKCGARISNETDNKSKEDKSSRNEERFYTFLGGAILVVAVALFLFYNFVPGSLTPEWALSKFYNEIVIEEDYDKVKQLYPKEILETFGESNIKENFYDDDSAYSSMRLKVYFLQDDGQKLKFKATGHSILLDEEREQVEEFINKKFGTDIEISDAATVDFKLVTTKKRFFGLLGSSKKEYSGGLGTYAYKYKGLWYYLDFSAE